MDPGARHGAYGKSYVLGTNCGVSQWFTIKEASLSGSVTQSGSAKALISQTASPVPGKSAPPAQSDISSS